MITGVKEGYEEGQLTPDEIVEEGRLKCKRGWHDDPDNSGQCIRCRKVLDE